MTNSNDEGVGRQKQLSKLVDRKLQDMEKNRLSVNLAGRDIVVKEQVRKVVYAVLGAKDIIGAAISAEPHAALAWAGVVFVLPVS
jgi:hypothetical protein